jgi:hypothetical protein
MIKIDGKYSISRDRYNWILHTTTKGVDEAGNDKEKVKKTFHASFPQVCRAILEREAGHCQTVEELKRLFEHAVEKFEHLKEPTFGAQPETSAADDEGDYGDLI